jgi:GNAT superfamily N-acetyltransferase
MQGSSRERAATDNDLPAVAGCLASAFYDDPVWGVWAFPDRISRYERVYELMQFWAAVAMRHSWVRIADHAEASAVWIPPGKPEMTSQEEERFAALVARLWGERTGEAMELFGRFEAHHPKQPPHYYLSLWGTHRDHGGRGVGTALMRENLARIDAEGAPAYLESTNPVNLARYEALGFLPTGEFGPDGGPVITTMWREPRAVPPR